MKKVFFCLIFLISVGLVSFAQTKYTVSDFDNAFTTAIKAENTALTARIQTYHSDIREFNSHAGVAVRNHDDLTALRLTAAIDSLHPGNADINNFKGKLLAKTGNYKAAAECFKEAIRINPANRWFYINLAGALAENAEEEEALKATEKLTLLYPEWSIGYNYKAGILQLMGRRKEALAAYNKAVLAIPLSALIYTNRASLYLELNQKETALADYKKALEIQPDYQRALVGISGLNSGR